jgi:DNA-binding transcriptional ArsR family regulator
MSLVKNAEEIAKVFENIAIPSRLAILLAIGEGEACVCHLEAVLAKRQAYVSQHLMALRDAGIITPRREGRFIYYRITNPGLFELIRNAARLAGVEISAQAITTVCECPDCAEQKPGYLPLIDKA